MCSALITNSMSCHSCFYCQKCNEDHHCKWKVKLNFDLKCYIEWEEWFTNINNFVWWQYLWVHQIYQPCHRLVKEYLPHTTWPWLHQLQSTMSRTGLREYLQHTTWSAAKPYWINTVCCKQSEITIFRSAFSSMRVWGEEGCHYRLDLWNNCC